MVAGLETSGERVRSFAADWCCRWLLPPRALVLQGEERHHHGCCPPQRSCATIVSICPTRGRFALGTTALTAGLKTEAGASAGARPGACMRSLAQSRERDQITNPKPQQQTACKE